MGSTIVDVRRAIVIGLVLTFFAAASLPLRAIEPADPEMSAEASEVLDYLASIYGQKTLLGQDKFWETDRFHETTGKMVALCE